MRRSPNVKYDDNIDMGKDKYILNLRILNPNYYNYSNREE
jgi:hypothetical protein